MYTGGPICWNSKRQITVVFPSTEADIIAGSEIVREIVETESCNAFEAYSLQNSFFGLKL